jgi:hypothetical protein
MKSSFSLALRILQVAVLVFGLAGFAFAQSASSEVNGVVKDPTGAVISGATIHLIDVATNTEVTTTSTEEGRYVFANVRPGVYKIVAEQTGAQRARRIAAVGTSLECLFVATATLLRTVSSQDRIVPEESRNARCLQEQG